MACNDPPAPPGKKRKLTQTNEDLKAKRQKEEVPNCETRVVPQPALPGTYFVPYKQGTIRTLNSSSPGFLAAKEHIESLIGHSFEKAELLLEAMYPVKNEWARIGPGLVLREANYRLAMVGDVVLKMAILDARFNILKWNGTTDQKVQSLVSDENLAIIADTKGVTSHLVGWYSRGSAPSKKAKATTVEAIIGAVWFDSERDCRAVKKVLSALLGENLDDEVFF